MAQQIFQASIQRRELVQIASFSKRSWSDSGGITPLQGEVSQQPSMKVLMNCWMQECFRNKPLSLDARLCFLTKGHCYENPFLVVWSANRYCRSIHTWSLVSVHVDTEIWFLLTQQRNVTSSCLPAAGQRTHIQNMPFPLPCSFFEVESPALQQFPGQVQQDEANVFGFYCSTSIVFALCLSRGCGAFYCPCEPFSNNWLVSAVNPSTCRRADSQNTPLRSLKQDLRGRCNCKKLWSR